MAFNRPTLPEIIERVRGDLRAELNITAIVRRTFLAAIARAISGAAHSLHGHLKELSKQAFPDQADGIYLSRWGAIYGVPAKEATYTQLTISGTGTNGSTLTAGDVFTIDNGETFEVDTTVVVALGVYETTITAVNPGASTNLDDGETVTLESPITGIDSVATVDNTLVEGEDAESESSHQERIVARIQQPPAGGKVSDYVAWGLAVAGVSRVWVFPGWLGQGTVGVSFLELDSGEEVVPGAPKVAEVQEYINEQKPVTADVTVFAPNVLTVNVTVKITPNTAAVQAAVTAELEDLFRREAQISGAVDPDNVGTPLFLDGKISISKFDEAVSIADGENDHEIVTPTADIEPDEGYIAQLGTITFQTLV